MFYGRLASRGYIVYITMVHNKECHLSIWVKLSNNGILSLNLLGRFSVKLPERLCQPAWLHHAHVCVCVSV